MLRTTWLELTKESHALIARTAETLALPARAATVSARRHAPRASSRRPLTPSLRKTLRACVRTVSMLTESAIAISALERPS